MVNVIARMEIREGQMPAFRKLLDETVPLVRAEAGCIAYTPCADADPSRPPEFYDPNCVTIVECWESEAHLKAHHQTPHMARFRELAAPMRKPSKVYVVKPL